MWAATTVRDAECVIPGDVVRRVVELLVPPSGVVDVVAAPDGMPAGVAPSRPGRAQAYSISELGDISSHGAIVAVTLRFETSVHHVLVRAVDHDSVVVRPFCGEGDCWCHQMPDRRPIPMWASEIVETARMLARGTDRRPGVVGPDAGAVRDSLPHVTVDPTASPDVPGQ